MRRTIQIVLLCLLLGTTTLQVSAQFDTCMYENFDGNQHAKGIHEVKCIDCGYAVSEVNKDLKCIECIDVENR